MDLGIPLIQICYGPEVADSQRLSQHAREGINPICTIYIVTIQSKEVILWI